MIGCALRTVIPPFGIQGAHSAPYLTHSLRSLRLCGLCVNSESQDEARRFGQQLPGGLTAGVARIEHRACKEQHAVRDDVHAEPHILVGAGIPDSDDEVDDRQIH